MPERLVPSPFPEHASLNYLAETGTQPFKTREKVLFFVIHSARTVPRRDGHIPRNFFLSCFF